MRIHKASFWRRAFAYLIDGLIFIVPSSIIEVWFGLAEVKIFFEWGLYLYFIFMEANFQKTIGKHLMGIKVVKLNGKKPTLPNCFWRNAARMLSPFYFLIGGHVRILAPHRLQTIHDEFAKCLVVVDES
jgi:uncharacterized RDD family membrane protein YckC